MMGKTRFAGSLALGALATSLAVAAPAAAAQAAEQTFTFDMPAQDLDTALKTFARVSRQQISFNSGDARGKRAQAVKGSYSASAALAILLRGSDMVVERGRSGLFLIRPAGATSMQASVTDTRLASLAGGPVQQPSQTPPATQEEPIGSDIIVTAQKREESIQDVPIAVSAFSGQMLDDLKIEGGSELMRAIPNVTFSKSNFSMYNFSIRGIGTKAISASSDPAVAVSFNNTPLVRNRLFEQEFFDIQRVEVLRGPQGTLYGRNATAGVVNVIPALPIQEFEAEIKAEVGSYETTRLSGMLNVPIGPTLAARVAGAWTKRDGFDYNTFTQKNVNGRDLWSARASLAWEPSPNFRANVIWQHFEEDDDRSRTGKQLCTNDPGPTMVGNAAVTDVRLRGKLSQGCLPGSLYDDAAYGVPNGLSLVYLQIPSERSYGRQPNPNRPDGRLGPIVTAIPNGIDPFEGVTQSRNLREVSTSYDPKFRAQNDVVQLNLEFEPADGLQIISQTAYSQDYFWSTQDYNRFVSNPLFADSSQILLDLLGRPVNTTNLPTPGGIYCDPQLGCSDRMISADLSRSKNRQWSQEFRLQSEFSGPINFNVGVNYLDFKSQDDYYVFNNMFTFIADWFYSSNGNNSNPGLNPCELGSETRECPYVDRNSLSSLDNQGHNYFLSQNGIQIKSLGLFGEVYWNVASDLKLTLGGRYTRDRKISDQIPSQLLLGGGGDNALNLPAGDITGGRVNSGYPALPDIRQSWGEFTGRAVLDWKPTISFTDETLVYVSAARGYKGGGTNPPRVDFNPAVIQYQFLPETFRPEFVNAFEIGMKNSFDGGRFTLNATGFFYDYTDYQVSQIVDRIAYNENFDATSMGLEFEAAWRPSRSFRIDGNLGLLKTRLGKGAQSIDVMNRTQGNSEWVLLRPWLQVPSNCVAPREFVERVLASALTGLQQIGLAGLCPGSTRIGSYNPEVSGGVPFNSLFGFTYDPLAPYNPDTVGLNIAEGGSGAPNGGRGFFAPLEGNELPNAPRMTANIGAQYTFFVDDGDWELTLRGDYYRQSGSFARIYNTEFDRLRAWDNVNVAVTLARPASEVVFQFYIKNLFDNAPITDFFINSDDTGLTTNVFTTDPRIIGFNVSKRF